MNKSQPCENCQRPLSFRDVEQITAEAQQFNVIYCDVARLCIDCKSTRDRHRHQQSCFENELDYPI